MFKVTSDKTIHITRGDIGTLKIGATNEDGSNYVFKDGDVVRLKVSKNKLCNTIEIQKDVKAIAGSEMVELNLVSKDTKIGEIINAPTVYWYEIELNPDTEPQTIIGFDEFGAKVFKLYPELGDKS